MNKMEKLTSNTKGSQMGVHSFLLPNGGQKIIDRDSIFPSLREKARRQP